MATTTEDKTKTKDQVKELWDSGIHDATQIADKLGKTKATIYVHLRNLNLTTKSKRGRPPKAQGTESAKPKAASQDSSNGRLPVAQRFPAVAAAIEAELKEARSRVATLEGMLETISK